MLDAGPILLFDGVCTLCDRSVQFVLDHEAAATFRFASLQSEAGQTLLTDCHMGAEVDSVVLVDEGRCYVRSEAAWRIAAKLDAPWRWVAVGRWLPLELRDRLYDAVARRRYRWFGTREACRMPRPGERERFLHVAELAPRDGAS